MTKRIFAVLIAVVLCLSMVMPASAAGNYISDPDYYLFDEEIIELNDKAQYIEDNYGYAVVFCVAEDSGFDNAYDFAEDCYNNATDSEYGVALAHNIGTAKMAIYVTEKAQAVIDDTTADSLCDIYYASESYFGGVSDYLGAVESVLLNADAPVETSANEEKETEFTPVERTLPLVVDNADLLTDEEESKLEEKLNKFTKKHKMEAAVLTVNDLEGKTPQEYADDFYDYEGYGYGDGDDGLLVLYKSGEEGERELYITTHGKAKKNFNDTAINNILKSMKDHLAKDNYAKAFDVFVEKCEEEMTVSVSWFWLPVCLLAGFIISFIITAIMASSLKSVRSKKNATDYVRQGSLVLTGQQNIFLYRNVTKQAIEKNNNNGSSTHQSSSGRTHGGGGISF